MDSDTLHESHYPASGWRSDIEYIGMLEQDTPGSVLFLNAQTGFIAPLNTLVCGPYHTVYEEGEVAPALLCFNRFDNTEMQLRLQFGRDGSGQLQVKHKWFPEWTPLLGGKVHVYLPRIPVSEDC